jgi:hypothetical protein
MQTALNPVQNPLAVMFWPMTPVPSPLTPCQGSYIRVLRADIHVLRTDCRVLSTCNRVLPKDSKISLVFAKKIKAPAKQAQKYRKRCLQRKMTCI